MRRTICWCLFITAVMLCMGDVIFAMPAFARKYRMSCTVCHAPIPRLKDYGDEFAGNGFILKDKDAPRYTVETGDDNLSLIRDLPLGFRFEGHGIYNSVTDREFDFSWPWVVKILSGGSLGPHAAYYFYFFFDERGEVAGIEDAFFMFNDVANTELDIYLGQFQASDPLFKGELRLTFEGYQIYGVHPGQSAINLKYDRGVMLTYGFPSGTDMMLEILNGNGIGEADATRTYDNDKYKTFMGRISQDVIEPLRIGAFGYYGKEGQDITNEVEMVGPDMTIAIGPLELNLQYVYRRDSDPSFLCTDNAEIETEGGFGELVYWPHADRSKWYAVGLFNWIDSDLDDLKYQTVTGHFGYLLRTNIRLTTEFTYDIENEENRASIGFVTGF